MVAITGQLTRGAGFGMVNPYLSSDLRRLDDELHVPRAYNAPARRGTTRIASRSAQRPRVVAAPRVARSFHDDFYNRIHVRPASLPLGNLASSQVREVRVWNAYIGQAQVLKAATLADGAGLAITAPGAYPITFTPNQERAFQLRIESAGPPVIDARLTFTFTGLDGIELRVTGNRMVAWPVPADWGSPVDEQLQWRTEVSAAEHPGGDEERIPQRAAPRRSYAFDLLEGKHERRVLEAMLYDWSARVWAVPLWHEGAMLRTTLEAGTTRIPVDTRHLDYRPGGLAMLWRDVGWYDLAQVAEVEPDGLVLDRPLSRGYAGAARIYPCRTGRLDGGLQLRRLNDRVIRGRVSFAFVDPSDWPALPPPALYLGHPVLEQNSDESQDPTARYDRTTVSLDGDIGGVAVLDLTGLPRPVQSHASRLVGRAERAAHRSLAYWLQGQARTLWLPTNTDDVELVETTGPSGDALVVAWAAIAAHLRLQPGRRHLRIRLRDGRTWYRRVEAVEDLGDGRERLLLSTGIGEALAPVQVAQICWMALSRLSSDTVAYTHVGDSEGLADCRLMFVAAPEDEP